MVALIHSFRAGVLITATLLIALVGFMVFIGSRSRWKSQYASYPARTVAEVSGRQLFSRNSKVEDLGNPWTGPRTKQSLVSAYGKVPISFEVNEGQADHDVRFLAKGRGYDLLLKPTELVLKTASADRG